MPTIEKYSRASGKPTQDGARVVGREAARSEGRYGALRPEGTRNGWPMRLVYFVSDFGSFGLSLVMAKGLITLVTANWGGAIPAQEAKLYVLWVAGLIAVSGVQRTYAAFPPRPVRKFRGWVIGALSVCATIVGAAWLLEAGSWLAALTLGLATLSAVLLASFCRALCRIVFGKARWWGTRLVVVGGGELAAQTYADLLREPQWGLRPVGIVDETGLAVEDLDRSDSSLRMEQLDALAAEQNCNRALVAVHSFDTAELSELLSHSSGRIKHWIILPPLAQFPSMWLEACEAARRPAFTVTNRLRSGWSLPLKRFLDLSVSLSLGLLVLPLVVLIVVLVRLSSPGPAFYGQERIGRFGRRFKAWKFRTMLPNADDVLQRYLELHPDLAAEWQANHKLRIDPRVTWIGKWLRAISLDELPQVWNVIVGDMSLVGPRPIVAAEIDKYAEHYEQYVQVLPGITGLWQVSGRNNTTYEERVALDVYYVQNWSLWLDVYILACTAKVVLLCEGAY